jgi:hypothetical protein
MKKSDSDLRNLKMCSEIKKIYFNNNGVSKKATKTYVNIGGTSSLLFGKSEGTISVNMCSYYSASKQPFPIFTKANPGDKITAIFTESSKGYIFLNDELIYETKGYSVDGVGSIYYMGYTTSIQVFNDTWNGSSEPTNIFSQYNNFNMVITNGESQDTNIYGNHARITWYVPSNYPTNGNLYWRWRRNNID